MAIPSATGTIRSTAAQRPAVLGGSGPRLLQHIVRERWMYLFIVPGALSFLLFEYLPLLGNIIAFQDFSPFLGIRDSPFIGLENFRRLFTAADFKLALVNTVQIDLLQLVSALPAQLVGAVERHSAWHTLGDRVAADTATRHRAYRRFRAVLPATRVIGRASR